jgi:hypothetical protein
MNLSSSYTCSFLLALKERNQRKARLKCRRGWFYCKINLFDAACGGHRGLSSAAAHAFDIPVSLLYRLSILTHLNQ